MFRKCFALSCLMLFVSAAGAGTMDGRWFGKGLVSMTAIKMWIQVGDGQDGPALVLDYLIGQGIARIGEEDTEPRYDGEKLLWKVQAGDLGTFSCEAQRVDDKQARAVCKQGEQQLALDLKRLEGNKYLSAQLETVGANAKELRYVKVLAAVAKAMSIDDFEAFDSYFVDNPQGTLPKELFRRALFITMKFGQIQRIVFREFDDPGAFVTVHFAENKRDFYLELDENGKLIELTYVPEPDPHFK